jgi:X-linked retinitis pigmentosa GTPase regulator
VPILISDISHIPMKHIAAGSISASLSCDAGDLYLWGSGSFGEFLTPHRVKTINGMTIDVSIGNHYGAAVNKDGFVYSWGHNNSGELG